MGSRFLYWLLATYVTALGMLGGIGYAVSRVWVPTPREVFRAAAFEFDLAPGWWCDHFEGEAVCRPPGDVWRQAAIIVTDKLRDIADTLEEYEEHLRQPKTITDRQGEQLVSHIRHVRRVRIGGREWVNGVHYQSEVPYYVTHYLATNTSHVGVVVTFSVRQEREQQFKGALDRLLETLRTYQR